MNLFFEYSSLDGLGLADLITRGEVTAKEFAHLILHAVEYINPHLNCMLEAAMPWRDRLPPFVSSRE